MNIDLVLVLLFTIATGVALLARWLKVPYTVALVLAGLVIGIAKVLPAPHLSKDLLFAVFLPGLLFEAAFHLDAKKFWANKLTINALAVPGVVASIAITALLLTPAIRSLHLELGFRLIDGFVFGGIVAATDPIAVVSLFKSLGVPKRLGVLIEGESLLNDGTAVVLFGVIFTLATGADITIGHAVLDFVRTCGLGLLVGVAVGFGGSRVIHWVDDPMIEITVTIVVAWGSFALAEQAHASGVLATVAAGLLCGNDAARTGMSPTTKIATITLWAYIAFALNSIVFLLIGLEIELAGVIAAWRTVLLAWAAMTAARALVIGGVGLLLRRTTERLPKGWGTVMFWGGIRGGLSMVLVLALPLDFPHRQFLLNVVFGVVVVSILVQGMTMAPLLKRLGIVASDPERLRYQRIRAEAIAARAALDELAELARAESTEPALLTELREHYEKVVATADGEIQSLYSKDSLFVFEERQRIVRHLTLIEKERVLKAIHEGLVSDEAAAEVLAALDAQLLGLDEDPPARVEKASLPAPSPSPKKDAD